MITNFEKYCLNENLTSINYCDKCRFILDSDDNIKCKYCKVLDILGIDEEHSDVYGKLKYLKRFKGNKEIINYIEDLKQKYNLSNEKINQIKDLLKIK